MDAENGDNGTLARIGAVLAPLVFVATWLAPLPLDEKPHRVAALTAAVVVCWVTEVLPLTVTALLIAPGLVALGISDPKTAFAPYADPLLFLFYASFFLAESMTRHGLDRRLAHALMRAPGVAGDAARTRFALMVIGAAMSMWMSNTTATAIVLPILLGSAAGSVSSQPGRSPLTGGLLGVAYACSVGGMGTPVGTPPNLITMRMLEQAGIEMGFFDWMKIGIPAACVTTLLSYFVVQTRWPAAPLDASAVAAPPAAWSRGERVTAWGFALAILGWVAPELLDAAGVPGGTMLAELFPASTVGLFAATLVFALREKPGGERVLPWSAARHADWGVIMLFGGGIALGSAMFDSGLSAAVGRGFTHMTGTLDVWTLTASAMVLTVVMSELTSNTATANMLLPIVLGIATEMHVSPIPPALGVGLGATCGFMLPVATGPNALVYGTGHLSVMQMVRTGFVFDLCCMAAVFMLLRILCPLYGWA